MGGGATGTVLLVGAGGALGALARYGLGRLVAAAYAGPVPLWTWAPNLAGCLLIGVAVATLDGARAGTLFFVVGFLGAFTTFSTFGLETVRLLQRDLLGAALVNVVGSVVLGVVLVWAGLRIGAWLLPAAGG